ncbi:radial spoke 3 [Echinococcus multilocularis]|uniref:Radial spoke 3 n=1 Tax=Echinococcus multilocularis TaxID=6211 RepID=A0A068YG48_ECHMU|nr:radial spoke 3 [Echinococcus multilocularis]
MEETRSIRSFPIGRNKILPLKFREGKVTNYRDSFGRLFEKRLVTPPPVKGRDHTEAQTELYLEELSEVIETDTVCCQTDDFLDRPPTPLFVPAKTGVDVATEIPSGDLFDFDLEVKPILEVLVGKLMEQALLEVCEEEELAEIRKHQLEFEEIRDADLMEMQRLAERERRYREEKERRIAQHLEYQAKQKELVEKIAARTFARVYLEPLVPNVYEDLYIQGYFYDVVEHGVAETFIPWLLDAVCEELDVEAKCRALLDSMICEATHEVNEAYARLDACELEEGVVGEEKEGNKANELESNAEMETNLKTKTRGISQLNHEWGCKRAERTFWNEADLFMMLIS